MEVENFALAREEVIFDVEAVHGFEVAAEDCNRDEFGDSGGFIASLLDGVQGFEANFFIGWVEFIPLRDAGVKVPTVVIEARLAAEFFDFVPLLFFYVQE